MRLMFVFAMSVFFACSVCAQTLKSDITSTIPGFVSTSTLVDETIRLEAMQAALRNAGEENASLQQRVADLEGRIVVGDRRTTSEASESFAKVVESYNNSWINYYSHEEALRDRALSALSYQLLASKVVLALVVIVVGLGAFLSYREVMSALKAPKVAADHLSATRTSDTKSAEEEQSVARQQTELVLSLQKLQLTSAVTGVIILGLSLGFLFLFLNSAFGLDPQDFASVAEPQAEQQLGPMGGAVAESE